MQLHKHNYTLNRNRQMSRGEIPRTFDTQRNPAAKQNILSVLSNPKAGKRVRAICQALA